MALQYDGITELLKAAPKRLADAHEMLELPSRDPHRSDAPYRHLCAAEYLAGYAVECRLKAYIIERSNLRFDRSIVTWSQVLDLRDNLGLAPELRGARAHRLDLLFGASDLAIAMADDDDLKALWATCCKWDTALRYRPIPVTDRRKAEEMVAACEAVYNWIGNQFPIHR